MLNSLYSKISLIDHLKGIRPSEHLGKGTNSAIK